MSFGQTFFEMMKGFKGGWEEERFGPVGDANGGIGERVRTRDGKMVEFDVIQPIEILSISVLFEIGCWRGERADTRVRLIRVKMGYVQVARLTSSIGFREWAVEEQETVVD